MPLYQYQCNACDHSFTEVLKIDNRHDPINNDCPNCGGKGHIQMVIGAPMLLYSVDRSLKTDDAFNDRMIEIKKTKGRGNTIETRRSPI